MQLKKKRVVKKDVREKRTHQRTAVKPVVKKDQKQAEITVVAPKSVEVKADRPEIKKQHRQPKQVKPVVEEVVEVIDNNMDNNEQNI